MADLTLSALHNASMYSWSVVLNLNKACVLFYIAQSYSLCGRWYSRSMRIWPYWHYCIVTQPTPLCVSLSVWHNSCACLSITTPVLVCLLQLLCLSVCHNSCACLSVTTLVIVCLLQLLCLSVCHNSCTCLSVTIPVLVCLLQFLCSLSVTTPVPVYVSQLQCLSISHNACACLSVTTPVLVFLPVCNNSPVCLSQLSSVSLCLSVKTTLHPRL